MQNDYVRMIHQAMQERKENIILVNKLMLSTNDIELIKELAVIYNKTVILGSTREMIVNNDINIYVVE